MGEEYVIYLETSDLRNGHVPPIARLEDELQADMVRIDQEQ